MSTSKNNENIYSETIKWSKRNMLVYLISFLFVIAFGQIYALFSHGIFSWFMIFAFVPLLICFLVWLAIWLLSAKTNIIKKPDIVFQKCFNLSAIILSIGCIVQGVVDIYGTTSRLISVYWIVGLILLAVALIYGIAVLSFGKKDE